MFFFYFWRNLKKIQFTNTQLYEADFTECDLTEGVFENCDLKRAIFDNTNLEKTDFRTAYNYAFDPNNNRLKKTRFALPAVLGLLGKYDIDIEGIKIDF